MSLFGWSYPPGCSSRDIENAFGGDDTCEVCGKALDDCICPECPTCGTQGDPACYGVHGLTLTPAQAQGRAELDAYYQAQADADKAEAEYWTHPDRKKEAAELAEMYREQELHHSGEKS